MSNGSSGGHTLAAGHMLGRYRLLRLLGSGAMGDVYLAEDPQIERQLAIKTVRVAEGKPADVEERKRRLLREAKAAGKLIHPNVVTLYDAGEAEGVLYLAFEFVNGSDLAKRLEDGPALSIGEALRIARETADALETAHRQGIVHRDIKPANLLLDQNGRVKVADFGIAKMVGQGTELTMDGSIVGSPHYLSPEQVRGEVLDGRSDIFSLGVVVYEMFGNQRPFQGESLTTLVYQILHQEPPPVPCARPDLAPRLAELLQKMLTKDREQRFPHAGAVVAALAKLERDLPLEVLALPASVDASTFEGTRMMAESDMAAAAAPTLVPGALPATVLKPAPPALPAPAAAPAASRRSPLPFVIGGLLLLLAGAGFGGWWLLFGRRAPAPPSVQTAVTPGVGVAVQPSAAVTPPRRSEPAPAPATPSAPAPAAMPAQDPIPEPRRVEPRRAEPASPVAYPPAAPIVRSEPRRPAAPEPRTPAAPEPRAPAPVPTAPAPDPEPEAPAAVPDLRFDREMSTGTALSFKVAPDDAVIKVRQLSERRAIVIGRAGDYTGKNKETKAYGLPDGPGDYLVTISHDGAEHVILAHAEAGRPTTQIVFTFAGAGKRRRGN